MRKLLVAALLVAVACQGDFQVQMTAAGDAFTYTRYDPASSNSDTAFAVLFQYSDDRWSLTNESNQLTAGGSNASTVAAPSCREVLVEDGTGVVTAPHRRPRRRLRRERPAAHGRQHPLGGRLAGRGADR